MSAEKKPELRVVPIPKYETWDEIVGVLEGLLARAKAGELRAVCVVSEDVAGNMTMKTRFGIDSSPAKMIGAIATAQARIIKDELE